MGATYVRLEKEVGRRREPCVKSKVADGFYNFLLSNNGFSKTWYVLSLYISLSPPSFLLIFHPPIPFIYSLSQDPLPAALSPLSLFLHWRSASKAHREKKTHQNPPLTSCWYALNFPPCSLFCLWGFLLWMVLPLGLLCFWILELINRPAISA